MGNTLISSGEGNAVNCREFINSVNVPPSIDFSVYAESENNTWPPSIVRSAAVFSEEEVKTNYHMPGNIVRKRITEVARELFLFRNFAGFRHSSFNYKTFVTEKQGSRGALLDMMNKSVCDRFSLLNDNRYHVFVPTLDAIEFYNEFVNFVGEVFKIIEAASTTVTFDAANHTTITLLAPPKHILLVIYGTAVFKVAKMVEEMMDRNPNVIFTVYSASKKKVVSTVSFWSPTAATTRLFDMVLVDPVAGRYPTNADAIIRLCDDYTFEMAPMHNEPFISQYAVRNEADNKLDIMFSMFPMLPSSTSLFNNRKYVYFTIIHYESPRLVDLQTTLGKLREVVCPIHLTPSSSYENSKHKLCTTQFIINVEKDADWKSIRKMNHQSIGSLKPKSSTFFVVRKSKKFSSYPPSTETFKSNNRKTLAKELSPILQIPIQLLQ